MIVPLLVSVIRTETIPKRFKHALSKKRAAAKTIEEDDQNSKNVMNPSLNYNRNTYVDFADTKRSRRNEIYSGVRNSKIRRSRTNSATSDRRFLAQKLANDALKSAKMQETMKKLTNVKTPQMGIYETVRTPLAKATSNKSKVPSKKPHESTRRKGRKKKKGRRHRRRFGKRSRWPKRGSAQSTFDTGKGSVKPKGESKSAHTTLNHNRPITRKQTQNTTTNPSKKVKIIQLDREDYIDSSSTMSAKTSLLTITPREDELSVRDHESDSMIESLMKTTTRDPTKKKPEDQGAEYSEYYSNDDVLEDIAANKIQMKIAEPRDANDRFTRQTISNSSVYNQISGIENVRPYSRDFNKYDRVSEYDDDSQSYPVVAQSLDDHENSRLSDGDASFHFAPDYATALDERRENSGVGNFLSTEEIPMTISDVEADNFDLPERKNVNSEFPQPVVRFPQYSKNLYSSNGDVNPEVGRQQNFAKSQAQISGLEDADLQISDRNALRTNTEDAETHRNSNIAYTQIRRPSFRRDAITRAEMQKTKANEAQQSPFQPPSQSDTLHMKNAAQNLYDLPNEYPPTNLANAMQQPFGQVLRSLGINVQPISDGENGNLQAELNENVGTFVTGDSVRKADCPRSSFSGATLARDIDGISGDDQLSNDHNDGWSRSDGGNNLRRPEPRVAKPVEGFDSGAGCLTSAQAGEAKKMRKDNLLQIAEEDRDANAGRSNISVAVNETKEIANQILGRIIDELDDLKIDRSKNNKREGLPCRLSGSWLTTRAGIKLDMKVVNRSIIVHLKELIPPLPAEVLFNSSWNMTGHAPFRMGAPFSLIATNNRTKSMAVFIGACRICQGVDTIAGVWSIAQQPKDCRDFQIATNVFNDIFRKMRLSSSTKEEEQRRGSVTQVQSNAGSEKTENTTRTSRSGKGS